MCKALTALAAEDPDWLRTTLHLTRYTRYAQEGAILKLPWQGTEQHHLSQAIAGDVSSLLQTVDGAGRTELARLPEVRRLRQAVQRYELSSSSAQRSPTLCSLYLQGEQTAVVDSDCHGPVALPDAQLLLRRG